MFNKGNIFGLIKLAETRGARKVDDLSTDGPFNPLSSRLVCDRGEIVGDIAGMLNVAGIAVEIRPSFRPDIKGMVEKAFRSLKEYPNV